MAEQQSIIQQNTPILDQPIQPTQSTQVVAKKEGYKFKTKPYQHQLEGCKLLWSHKIYAILSEMGTGKSKVVVDTACALYSQPSAEPINLVILFCPNTVRNVWADDQMGQIITHTPDYIGEKGVYVISEKNIHKHLTKEIFTTDSLVWLILNYEQMRSEENVEAICELMQCKKTMLVLDESTSIKNATAKQTKGIMTIAPLAVRRYILTGTPISKNPLDFYSQFLFLDRNILGYDSFAAMQYDLQENQYNVGPGVSVIKKFRPGALEKLQEKITKFSMRHLKKDCLDIPEKTYMTIPVEMSEQQNKAYEQMQKFSSITIKAFEQDNPQTSSAPIVITQMLRLQQICSGFFNTDDKVPMLFDENPKVEVILDLVKDKEKTIVFARFKQEIRMLRKRLTEEGIKTVEISGDVKEDERKQAERDFEKGDAQVIICQTETGGIGITLIAADTVIYMSNTFSFKDRAQSEDRAHRAGQTKKVTYYDLVSKLESGSESIDAYIIEAVSQKKEISDFLLSNVRGILM